MIPLKTCTTLHITHNCKLSPSIIQTLNPNMFYQNFKSLSFLWSTNTYIPGNQDDKKYKRVMILRCTENTVKGYYILNTDVLYLQIILGTLLKVNDSLPWTMNEWSLYWISYGKLKIFLTQIRVICLSDGVDQTRILFNCLVAAESYSQT